MNVHTLDRWTIQKHNTAIPGCHPCTGIKMLMNYLLLIIWMYDKTKISALTCFNSGKMQHWSSVCRSGVDGYPLRDFSSFLTVLVTWQCIKRRTVTVKLFWLWIKYKPVLWRRMGQPLFFVLSKLGPCHCTVMTHLYETVGVPSKHPLLNGYPLLSFFLFVPKDKYSQDRDTAAADALCVGSN